MDIGESSRIRPCSVQLSKLNLEVLETYRYFKIRAGSNKRYIVRKPWEEKVTHSLSVQTVSTMRSFTDKLNCDNELQSEYLPECINGYLETTKEELDSITRSVDKIDQIRSLYSVTLPTIEKKQCLGIERSRKSKSIDSISNTPSAEKRNALAKLEMSVKNNQHKLCCLKKSLFSTNRQIPTSERCDHYSSTDADSEATIIHNEGGRPKRKRKIRDKCRACEEDSRENDNNIDDDTINVECIPQVESLSKSEHLYHHRVRMEPSHKRIKVDRVQNDNTLKVSINLRRLPDDYIKRLLKKDTSIRSIANHLPSHTNTTLSDFRSSKSYSSAPLKNLHVSSNKQLQSSLQHPISDSESSSSTATTASSTTESGSLLISNDANLATSSNESGSLPNSNGAIPTSISNETGSVFISNKATYFGTFNGSITTPILIPAATASNSIGLVLQPILFAATTASSSNGPASAVHLNCATLTTSSNELISSPILFAATLATTSNELMPSPILLPTTTATTSNELMSSPIFFAATLANSSNELTSSSILLPSKTASSCNRLSPPPILNDVISANSSYGSLTSPIFIPTTSVSRSNVCVSPSIVNSTTYATNIHEVQPIMHHVRDETTVMNSQESVLCSQHITSISKINNASTVSNRLSSLTDNLLDLSKLVKKRQTSMIEEMCIEREFDDNTEREDEHMTLVDIQGYSDASDISVVEEVVCSESTNCDAASYVNGPEIACSVTPPPISTTSYLKDALDLENILNQDTQDVLSSIAEERASKKCPYHDELPWASNRRSVTFDIRMTKSQHMHSTNAIDNVQNEDGAIEKILLEMELQSFNYVYGSRCSSSGKVSGTEGSGHTESESPLQNELAPIEEKYRATYDDNAVYYQMSDKNEFIVDDTAVINESENENPPEQRVVSNMLRLTMIAEPVIISETSETKMQEKGNETAKELSNSIEPLFISVVVNAIKQPPADSLSCHKVNPLIKRWNLDNPYGFSNSLHLTRKNTPNRGSVYLSKIRTSNILSSFMKLMKPQKMFPEILHPLFDANKAEQSLCLVTSPTNRLWPITNSMSIAARKLNSEITLNWTVQSFGRKTCTITESKQLSMSVSSHAFTNMSPKKTEDEGNQDFIEEDPGDGILNAEVNNNLIKCQLSNMDKLPANNDTCLVGISPLSSDRSHDDKRQPRHDNNLQSAFKTEAMNKKSRSRRKNSKPKPSKAQFRHKDISVFPVVQKVPLLLNNLEKIEKYKGIIKNVQKLTKNDKAQKQKLLKDANKSQADSSIFKLATAERLASELPHHNWLEQKYKIQNEQLEDDAPLPIAPDSVPVTIGTATYPIRRKRGYTSNIPKKRSSKRYIKNISNVISTATRIPEKPKKLITLDNDPIRALNAIADLYNITLTTFPESSDKVQDVTSTVKDDNDILRPNGTVIIEKAPKSTKQANDQFIRPSVIKLSGSSPKRPGSISVASWNIPKIDIKDLPPATEAIDLSRPTQTHPTNPVHHLSLPFKNPAPSVAVMEEPLSFVVLRTRNTPSPCLEWNFSKSSQVTDEVTDVSRKDHINSMSNRDAGVIKAPTQLLKHKVCPRIDGRIDDRVERDLERTITADAPSPYDRTVENISGLVSNVERAIEIVKNTGVKSSTLTHRNDHGNNVYPDNVTTPIRNRFFEQNSAMLSINDFYHNHLLTQRALNLPPLPLATFLDLAREQKRQEMIRTKEGSIHQNIPTVSRYDCATSNRHVFPEYENGIPSKVQSTYTSPFFTMPSIPTSVPEVSPHTDQYFPKLTTATPVTPQQAYMNSQSNMRPNADLQFTNHRPAPSKITPKRGGHDEDMRNRSVFDLPTSIIPEGPARRSSKRKEFWSNPTSSASASAEIFSSNIPALYSSSPLTSPANTLVSTYNSLGLSSRSQKSSDDLRYYLRQPPVLTPPQMGSNALQPGRNFVFSNSPYTHSAPFEQCVARMPEPIRMDIPDPPPLQSKPVTGITNHNISSGNFIAAAAEEPSERVRNRTPIQNGREILNEGLACGLKTNPAVGFAGDAPYGYRMDVARSVYPNTQEFTSPSLNAFQRIRDLCLTCGKPASQWFCHFCSKQWPYCCLPCFEVHRVTCHNAGLKKLKK